MNTSTLWTGLTRDELDEDKVLEILSKIKKMQLSTVNSLINLHNFQKSLNEYINAMDGSVLRLASSNTFFHP